MKKALIQTLNILSFYLFCLTPYLPSEKTEKSRSFSIRLLFFHFNFITITFKIILVINAFETIHSKPFSGIFQSQ